MNAFTGPDGTYDVGGLPAGTFRLQFVDFETGEHLAEYYDDVQLFDDAEDLEVASGETLSGLDASLTPAGSISGTVTDEEGDPVEGVSVAARDDAIDWGSDVETAADGTYELTGLPEGSSP